MAAPAPLASVMSLPNLRPCALQARPTRYRFAFQCMAVALFLTALVAMGVTGSGGWNVQAAPGQAGIPPTKDPDKGKTYATIEELLRESPHDTVVVLQHVEEADRAKRKTEAKQRFDNFVKFMKHVDDKRVRVAVLTHMQPNATTIDPKHLLPSEVTDVLLHVQPEYLPIKAPTQYGGRYFHGTSKGKTLWESKFVGVRNIVLLSASIDIGTFVPTFELVWNRAHVYRNVNLDPRLNEKRDNSLYAKAFDRMDHVPRNPAAQPLQLPTPLIQDPHLHYVPIGNIPGVLTTLPNAEYTSTFAPDGTAHPLAVAPGAKPRAGLGAFEATQKYDAQIRLVLDDSFKTVAEGEHRENRARSALVVVPNEKVEAFATVTKNMSAAQMRQEVTELEIPKASFVLPFKKDLGKRALTTGAVELLIDAHGGNLIDGRYVVGGLTPTQLASLIVAHPQLAVGPTLASGGMPGIRHIHVRACGVRCQADYEVGIAVDQPQDENAFAQALVLALRDEGVAVNRITVHNAKVLIDTLGTGEVGTWFMLRDANGDPRGIAYEAEKLSTTQQFDRVSGQFTEDPGFDANGMVAIEAARTLPPATHADVPRINGAGGQTPAWVEDSIQPAIASPGIAHPTRSGAVVAVSAASGVPPRLEASPAGRIVYWRAVDSIKGKLGTVVVTADLNAIAAGTRADAGKIVVVDTDPSRIEGVQQAVHLAGQSSDMADWIARLRANGLDTSGTALVAMWDDVATEDWNTDAETFQDPAVVERYNALKARALAGDFSFYGADLTTAEGAAVVNTSLGDDPVLLIWLPNDEMFLVRNVMLGARATRGQTLFQFRLNLALLMGPETTLWQQRGRGWEMWNGEDAFRDQFRLPNATTVADASAAGNGPVTVGEREQALIAEQDKALEQDNASDLDRDYVRDAMDDHDQGRLHEWWTRARETLSSVASWIRGRFAALMQSLGLWDAPAAQTPAEAFEMQERDATALHVQAQQLAEELLQVAPVVLEAHGLPTGDHVPVLHSVQEVDPLPCVQSGCTARSGEPEYEMRWLHEPTGEEQFVRTRDRGCSRMCGIS